MELTEIAQQLRDASEKIILIYAFNATGKTRLSVTYKDVTKDANGEHTGVYYNAFSEDLFVWDNDIENGGEDVRLTIVESSLNHFHGDLNEDKIREKLAPYNFGFYFELKEFDDSDGERNGKRASERGIKSISFYPNEQKEKSIKISRGEERIFIWCFFLVLFEVDAWTAQQAGHYFIDDPVSSLDDHNIFITATTLYDLIEKHYQRRKIIVTTHHIGLFSTLSDWLTKGEKASRYKRKTKVCLLSGKTGELRLENPESDVFLYHLQLMRVLDKAQRDNQLRTYHFVLLRQVLENVASFLGTPRFSFALEQIGVTKPDEVARIVNILSHQNAYHYQTDTLNPDNEALFRDVLLKILNRYNFILHGDAA